jgi:hypothetical protein
VGPGPHLARSAAERHRLELRIELADTALVLWPRSRPSYRVAGRGRPLGWRWVFVAALAALGPVDRASADSGARVEARVDRIFAAGAQLWIYSEPARSPHPIGYARAGTSLELRDGKRIAGAGCGPGFYAVKPFGYVCADSRATFDAASRYVRRMARLVPAGAAFPYGYALSDGAPMYRRLPSREEARRAERWLLPPARGPRAGTGAWGHERLAERQSIAPSTTFDPAVWTESISHRRAALARVVPAGSTVAYSAAVSADGRTWLESADGTLVPADHVRPYRPSTFAGAVLGHGIELPIAWVRQKSRPKFRRLQQGFAPIGAEWPVRAMIRLEAAPAVDAGGEHYLPTRERDARGEPLFVRASDVMRVDPAPEIGAGHTTKKWIWFSITRGTLVAYEGGRAVFATLASPGSGGVPRPGHNPVKDSTTPIGTFRLNFKHVSDDMSPDEGNDRRFWLAEVPWAQYFAQPFALHVAYWHEDFGEPMSGGCINVSPSDGKWLFDWTEPRLPEGWGGVGVGPQTGPGTPIVVVR